MIEKKAKGKWSFAIVLSLAAGITILIGSLVSSFWHMAIFPQMSGMMEQKFVNGVVLGSIINIVFGVIMIGGAILMLKKPLQTCQWGIMVMIASALSFIGMGGFMMGIVGMIGGILALIKKP